MRLSRFSVVSALVVAATLSLGSRANATFTITPTITAPSPNPSGLLTFAVLPLTNAVLPTPVGGISYQFATIDVANTPTANASQTTPYTFTFQLKDNTTQATTNFTITGSVSLTLTNGTGSLINTFLTVPTSFQLSGVNYTITPPPLNYTAPTLSNGSTAPNANFSMTINAAPVPEPAGFVMMGLGVGIAGLFLRRRMAVTA